MHIYQELKGEEGIAMGRGRPALGFKKELPTKKISSQDRKDLRVLASDFGLLGR